MGAMPNGNESMTPDSAAGDMAGSSPKSGPDSGSNPDSGSPSRSDRCGQSTASFLGSGWRFGVPGDGPCSSFGPCSNKQWYCHRRSPAPQQRHLRFDKGCLGGFEDERQCRQGDTGTEASYLKEQRERLQRILGPWIKGNDNGFQAPKVPFGHEGVANTITTSSCISSRGNLRKDCFRQKDALSLVW